MTSWPLLPLPPPPPPLALPIAMATANVVAGAAPFLGYGLLRPFVRDQKNDFANGGGIALVKACVGQVLGTRASNVQGTIGGELPWNPSFGSKLYLLKHKKGALLNELASAYVREALTGFEPRIILTAVQASFDRDERTLTLDVRYQVIAQNSPTNQVVFQEVAQSVNFAMAS